MVGYLKQQVDMPQFVESGRVFEGKLKVGFECILFTHLKSGQNPWCLLFIGDSVLHHTTQLVFRDYIEQAIVFEDPFWIHRDIMECHGCVFFTANQTNAFMLLSNEAMNDQALLGSPRGGDNMDGKNIPKTPNLRSYLED